MALALDGLVDCSIAENDDDSLLGDVAAPGSDSEPSARPFAARSGETQSKSQSPLQQRNSTSEASPNDSKEPSAEGTGAGRRRQLESESANGMRFTDNCKEPKLTEGSTAAVRR